MTNLNFISLFYKISIVLYHFANIFLIDLKKY